MKNKRVIIIAMDQPPDYDAHFRKRLNNLMSRSIRHAARFDDIDLPAIQTSVNENISKLQLRMNGKYMGLLDLMNYVNNGRRRVDITPENAGKNLTHSEMITLNGIYLYQYLHDRGYDPIVIQNYSLANLPQILAENPLAVCISSNFIYLDEIAEMASEVKRHDPGIPIIAGGMLVKKVLNAGPELFPQTLTWLETFHGKVDAFVIEFQGEQTLSKLLRALSRGGDLAEIPNLAFFDEGGKMAFTRREQETIDLDHTAIAWDRIPREYLRKTVPVTNSRGCFHRCRFCTCWRLCPEVYFKSLEVLRDELKRIQALGFVRHVRFTDDNFTGNRKRFKSVLQMMVQEDFSFTWSTYARAGSLTSELVALMKKAKCEFVNMGIESGSQTILDNMDKKLKRGLVIEAIKRLNTHGIYGEGGFILGYPGETWETFSETVDLINTSRLPYFQPNLFYYSKDMLVHQDRERFGLTGLGMAWKHNTMDATMASQLMVEMVRRVDHGFHEPQVSAWETFRLLRGEGYTPEEILDLFRLKRALSTDLEPSNPGHGFSPVVAETLQKLEAIVSRE